MEPLPGSFKSLYRLLSRSVSASVLHQPKATRQLRLIYRPVFDAAALVIQEYRTESNQSKKEELGRWLETWNSRMDHTLDLYYNSSQSRGLAHQVTHNLSFMVHSEKRKQWQIETAYTAWNPKAAPSPAQTKKAYAKLEKKSLEKEFSDNSLGAFTELMQMAEARDGVSLGRLILRRRVRRR